MPTVALFVHIFRQMPIFTLPSLSLHVRTLAQPIAYTTQHMRQYSSSFRPSAHKTKVGRGKKKSAQKSGRENENEAKQKRKQVAKKRRRGREKKEITFDILLLES